MKGLRFFTVLFVLLCCSCSVAQRDCKKYFAGKWKYDQYDVKKIYVVRTLEKQIEYVENGKYHYDFDIKWLSDCRYEISYSGTTSPTPAAANIGETTIVDIVKIDQQKMTYHTKFRELDENGEMTKLSN